MERLGRLVRKKKKEGFWEEVRLLERRRVRNGEIITEGMKETIQRMQGRRNRCGGRGGRRGEEKC